MLTTEDADTVTLDKVKRIAALKNKIKYETC